MSPNSTLLEPFRGDRYDNGVTGDAALTICVPTFHDNPDALIRAVSQMPGAGACAIVVYDDGSQDETLTLTIRRALDLLPGPGTLLCADQNLGRSAARNLLVGAAPSDWVLLLDADMLPDSDGFLTTYMDQIRALRAPAIIAGGFSLLQVTPYGNQRLHAAQARRSDCLSADERRTDPGRYVFTSNILVHRSILEQVPFDPAFSGWGWEDVDWGLRVAADHPVIHIDNTATHLGLEPDDVLVRKFGSSGSNFARLLKNHPETTRRMTLTRISRLVRGLPLIGAASRHLALQQQLPMSVRLLALKLYRARMYANHLTTP